MIINASKFKHIINVSCLCCLFYCSTGLSNDLANANVIKNGKQLKRAIAMRKSGEHSQAISILDHLRAEHHSHKRVNIELVLNYIKVKQYEDAENILAYVQQLNLTKREHKTVLKLKKLLEKMLRKSLSAHSLSIKVGAGIGVDIVSDTFPVYIYDSFQSNDDIWQEESIFEEDYVYDNEELVGDYEYVDIEDNWYREDITKESEVSYSRQFSNLSYHYRPPSNFLMFSHPTQWIISSDFSLDSRQLDKQENNNYLNIELGTSLYLLQVNNWLFELSTRLSKHYNEGTSLLNKTRTRLSLTLPFHHLKLKFAIDHQNRNYQHQLNEFDAKSIMPWFELSHHLTSDIRLVSGAKFSRLTAKDEINSYRNRDLYFGIYYSPTLSLITYLSYHKHRLAYEIDDLDYVNWSIEDKQSVALGVRYYLSDDLSINLNGNIGDKSIELGFGDNNWKRIEATFTYQF